jgi:YidC/Oxa1 family membrane protein insertase
MEKRFALFLILSTLVLFVHMALIAPPKRPAGRQDRAAAAKNAQAKGAQVAQDPKKPDKQDDHPPKPDKQPDQPAFQHKEPAQGDQDGAILPEPDSSFPERWVTLGSADPNDPYRMLVTLTSRGAAVLRIELSSPRYHDLEDRSGYLGHIVVGRALSAADALYRSSAPARLLLPPV